MNPAVIHQSVKQMTAMLKNLSGFLEKGATHATSKKTEMDVYLQQRLIADQFPLIKQVQTACDTAKLCASRLSSKTAPVYEDTEKTYTEIRTRISNTVAYLETFQESDFKDWESKKITFPWNPGKYLEAKEYFNTFVTGNFYFHVTTAYSILRANGVDVGKMDFLAHLQFKDA
jgi:hypothetical protein